MRRDYVYIIMLFICIVGIVWGIFGLVNTAYQSREANIDNNIEKIYENEVAITTSIEEEKISPKAGFALKKYYNKCNHFDYEEAELPIELVNLNKKEVDDYYDDWEIEKFSDKELILCKRVNGYCNQHFLIKLQDDLVSVFRLGTSGEPVEYKKTDISKEYLPDEDIENLEKGISVYGEGKISSVLEDFE